MRVGAKSLSTDLLARAHKLLIVEVPLQEGACVYAWGRMRLIEHQITARFARKKWLKPASLISAADSKIGIGRHHSRSDFSLAAAGRSRSASTRANSLFKILPAGFRGSGKSTNEKKSGTL